MSHRTKIVAAVLIVLAVIALAFALLHGPTSPASAKPVVTIGITLPLTGDIALLGQSNKNAILLAEARLPQGTKYSYKLVFEDDQFKTALGASTANKLISADGADALISFGSPVGNVVSPIAEAAHVPHINDFASDSHVANGVYNFVDYTPSYEDSAKFIAELKKRGITSLVFFAQQDNPGATAIIKSFSTDIQATDIAVLSTQSFTTGTRDFRTQIDKVKGLNPQIYVLEATTPELEILTQQLRDAGVKTPVTTMEAFEFSDKPALFEGMWYVNAADPEPWFTDLYTETYGAAPKLGAANGYDSLNLLVHAFETAGDGKTVPTGDMVVAALEQTKGYSGALGQGLKVGTDHLIDSKAVVRMIQGGVPVTIEG